MQIWRRRYYYKWLRYILQRPTKNLELISIDRGSIITYRKNFEFDNEKKKFEEKIYAWQDEEEADKDGRIMSYRDGMEGWEVSQSKERRKLGWVAKISDRGPTIAYGTNLMEDDDGEEEGQDGRWRAMELSNVNGNVTKLKSALSSFRSKSEIFLNG